MCVRCRVENLMSIHFSWTINEKELDEKKNEQDLKVFQLIISQREGEVAIAKLQILMSEAFKKKKGYGHIVYQDKNGENHLLFKGKQIGFPRKMNKGLAEIELSAEPDDAFEQLNKLADTLKVPPYFDVLFVKKDDNNPVNVLEARSDLFHWDRATGRLSLSNLFQGSKTVDVSKVILANSLKLKLGDTPLDSISITLSAEWVQNAEGEVNIYPKIAAQFPKGRMNTLTPSGLIAEWPKVGDKIGPALSRKQSGYQVVQSNLREITPLFTGVLDIHPTLTPEIHVKRDGKIKSLRLKRSWLKGDLHLHWHYLQKRRENLTFTLHHANQLKGKIRPRHKHLDIQLQSVDECLPNQGCSSFFITKRGHDALCYAIEMAKAYLAGSSRCIEVEFMIPFENAIQLTLDTSVLIQSSLIPGGKLIGKVVEYRLVQKCLDGYGWVRLAVSVGHVVESIDGVNERDIYGQDYVEDKFSSSHTTTSGITYVTYDHQQPTEGILYPQNLSLHDLVQRVDVKGHAEEQIDFLLENEHPKCDDALRLLNQMPTVVDVKLLDLRTQPVLEHTINLNVLVSWSAPEQIKV